MRFLVYYFVGIGVWGLMWEGFGESESAKQDHKGKHLHNWEAVDFPRYIGDCRKVHL
jgi:hypothetical protein